MDEKFKQKRNIKIVAVIHDLNRNDPLNDALQAIELRFFNMCDRIVTLNDNMTKFLVRHGVDERKCISVGIFDYLCTDPMVTVGNKKPWSIAICGNLSREKASYVYDLNSILCAHTGIVFELFGPGYDASLSKQGTGVTYRGSYPPDQLPSRLKSHFGLAWDGDSVDTCSGMFGIYTTINNPHKVSLYLAMGMPVIVWKRSAVATFVAKHQVGICVASLRDVPDILTNISYESYNDMKQNASVVGMKLRKGGYVRDAVSHCLNDIMQRRVCSVDSGM